MKLHIVRDYDLEIKSVHLSLKAARDKLRDASLFVDTREYDVLYPVILFVCLVGIGVILAWRI